MERILVVDDSARMRRTVREIVEPEAYEVVAEAADGDEAVELFVALRPDLVLLDLLLPRRSGIETLRDMRRIDARAAVVVCAGLGQERLAAQALVIGALTSVSKPFHPRGLLAALRRVELKRLTPARPS